MLGCFLCFVCQIAVVYQNDIEFETTSIGLIGKRAEILLQDMRIT